MNQTAEGREVFILDGLHMPVYGTRHKTADELRGKDAGQVALVFLNGLLATRSGHGDAVAYWADCFAEAGYPSYRIDLPGYGDSPGDAPEEWVEHINIGGDAEAAVAKIQELIQRFRLSGVVLVGQCSGAVTAIFAARRLSQCRGLILMEPYFFLATFRPSMVRRYLDRCRLRSPIGAKCRNIFRPLQAVYRVLVGKTIQRCRTLAGRALPDNANIALLDSWKQLVATGAPILLISAEIKKEPGRGPADFDYIGYIANCAEKTGALTLAEVEEATHTFSNQQGRLEIRDRALGWLAAKVLPRVVEDPAYACDRTYMSVSAR